MRKVCFISVYFGEIPDFFRTFLDSCAWNQDFNWLIVHDTPLNYEGVQNVYDITMDLDEFAKLTEKKIGLKIPKIKPYKVCDFRPAFGIIFEDYIKDYDFWGICDTDLILGKLNDFITDEMLDSYDKIFTMGHMSLIRNNNTCNWLFKKKTNNSRYYKDIFCNEKNFIYDEYEGFTEKFCDTGLKVYKEKKCADISIVCGRLRVNEKWLINCIQPKNQYIHYSNDKNFRHQIFWVSKGRTFRTYIDNKKRVVKEEYSYIHKLDYACDKKVTVDDSYILTSNGYVRDDKLLARLIEGKVNSDILDKYNLAHVKKEIVYDFYWYLRWNFRHFKTFIKRKFLGR